MNYSHELQVAKEAALAAGRIQLRHFRKPLKRFAKKGSDFATNVDLACEKEIVRLLKRAFPNDAILSEEAGEIHGSSGREWVVDPLDGTLPYAYGLPHFGTLLCLREKNRLNLGLVYQPLARESWHAVRNQGSFHNGKRIRVSRTTALARARMSFQNVKYPLAVCAGGFESLIQSAEYATGLFWVEGTMAVADGRLDVQVGSAAHLWDYGPAKIIVEEAGGIFSDYNGDTTLQKAKGCLSANPRLHKLARRFLHEPAISRSEE